MLVLEIRDFGSTPNSAAKDTVAKLRWQSKRMIGARSQVRILPPPETNDELCGMNDELNVFSFIIQHCISGL
jgi:hypothetical protein